MIKNLRVTIEHSIIIDKYVEDGSKPSFKQQRMSIERTGLEPVPTEFFHLIPKFRFMNAIFAQSLALPMISLCYYQKTRYSD